MIGGQVIDLENEGKDISEEILLRLYKDKTAALLRAAAVSGAILAGADEKKIAAADRFALNLGLAFQIVDDVLDYTGDEATLGKPIGSDADSNKSTYVTILGIDESRKYADELTNNAVNALEIFGEDGEFLRNLALNLVSRKN